MKKIRISGKALKGFAISDEYFATVLLHSTMAYLEDEALDETQALPFKQALYKWLREEEPKTIARAVCMDRELFNLYGEFIMSSMYYVGARKKPGDETPPEFTREQFIDVVNALMTDNEYGNYAPHVFAALAELMSVAYQEWPDDLADIVSKIHDKVFKVAMQYLVEEYPELAAKAMLHLKEQDYYAFADTLYTAYFETTPKNGSH